MPEDSNPIANVAGNIADTVTGGAFDKARYYINVYLVFMIATTILVIGILFIWGKPILNAIIAGKTGNVAGAVGAIKDAA